MLAAVAMVACHDHPEMVPRKAYGYDSFQGLPTPTSIDERHKDTTGKHRQYAGKMTVDNSLSGARVSEMRGLVASCFKSRIPASRDTIARPSEYFVALAALACNYGVDLGILVEASDEDA